MSKVIVVENDDGSIGFFDPPVEEYTLKIRAKSVLQEDGTSTEDVFYTEDEYLKESEASLIQQGVVTLGVLDKSAIPLVPVGGYINDLKLDGKQLVYSNVHQKQMLKQERNNLLIASDFDWLVAIKKGKTTLANNIVKYAKELQDLGAAIDANPSKVTMPKNPAPDDLRVKE